MGPNGRDRFKFLARYLRKTFCVLKYIYEKMVMRNLIIGALFSRDDRCLCYGKAPETRF